MMQVEITCAAVQRYSGVGVIMKAALVQLDRATEPRDVIDVVDAVQLSLLPARVWGAIVGRVSCTADVGVICHR